MLSLIVCIFYIVYLPGKFDRPRYKIRIVNKEIENACINKNWPKIKTTIKKTKQTSEQSRGNLF